MKSSHDPEADLAEAGTRTGQKLAHRAFAVLEPVELDDESSAARSCACTAPLDAPMHHERLSATTMTIDDDLPSIEPSYAKKREPEPCPRGSPARPDR